MNQRSIWHDGQMLIWHRDQDRIRDWERDLEARFGRLQEQLELGREPEERLRFLRRFAELQREEQLLEEDARFHRCLMLRIPHSIRLSPSDAEYVRSISSTSGTPFSSPFYQSIRPPLQTLQDPRPTPYGTLSRPNPASALRLGHTAPQASYSPHTTPLSTSISYPDLSKTDSRNNTPVGLDTSLGPAIQQSSYHERARSQTPQPLPSGRSEPNHSVWNSPLRTSGKNQLPGSPLVTKRPATQVAPRLSDPEAQGRPDIANSTESTIISIFRPSNPNVTNLPTYPRVGDTGHSQHNTQEGPTATEPRPPTSVPVPTLATHGTYSRASDPQEYNASQPPSQGSETPSNAADTNAASEQRDNSPAAINIYHIHNVEHGQRLYCAKDSAQKSEVYGSHYESPCAQWKIDGLGSEHMLTILNVNTNLFAAPEPLSGNAGQTLVAKGIKYRWHFARVPAPDPIYTIRHCNSGLYWKMTSNENDAVVELSPCPGETLECQWLILKKQSPGDGPCSWRMCK